MLRTLWVAILAVCAVVGGARGAPLEVYGRLPHIEEAAVSPGGKLIAYILTVGEDRTIAVESFPERKPVFIGNAGAAKVRSLTWAGEDHIIVVNSTARQPLDVTAEFSEWFLPFDLDLKKRRIAPMLDDVKRVDNAMNVIYGEPMVRRIGGKPVAFLEGVHFVDGEGRQGLFRVDVEKHTVMMVEPGRSKSYMGWVIDADGVVLAQEGYNTKSGVWTLMTKSDNGLWKTLQTVAAPIDRPRLIGLGRDSKTVLVGVGGKEGAGWRELAVPTGAWGEILKPGWDASPIHDPQTGLLIGTAQLVGDAPTYVFYAPGDAAVWRAVLRAYPGELVRPVSWSDDRKKILVRADSPDLGPAYAMVDLDTHQAVWLGPVYQDLGPGSVSPVKPLRYKAADGLEITGYLTLPRDRPQKDLPLIVLAHGGPAARDTPGFDWWAQALASRGYAVMQANFRGSEGFGEAFLAAGYGEWGRKMQTDLSDGVRHLAEHGVVDAKRVCIVGASYGGYAALAGPTIDPGVYRCAVSFGGISDLRDLMNEPDYLQRRYLRRFIGAESARDPMLSRYSPTVQAAQADAPILLIHGKDDSVVPISHSRKMAAALRRAGKPVEIVELAGEDHWLSRSETRQRMLQLTVDFLEKNNPPK